MPRLIKKALAAKPATNTQENSFYVEKARGNVIPKHFFEAKKAKVTIDGKSVELMMNAERSAYVAFMLGKDACYVKDHAFFASGAVYETFVKPVKEKPEKKKAKPKDKKQKADKSKGSKPKAGKSKKTKDKESAPATPAPAAEEPKKYELINTQDDEAAVEVNTEDVFVKRFSQSDFDQMVKGKHPNFIANKMI